jgi:hypothetical protein
VNRVQDDRLPNLFETEVVAFEKKEILVGEVCHADFPQEASPLAEVGAIGLEVLFLLDGASD